MDRTGKSYKSTMDDAVVLVTASKRMSHSTWRHTVVLLDRGNHQTFREGQTAEVDEVPSMKRWNSLWEEL